MTPRTILRRGLFRNSTPAIVGMLIVASLVSVDASSEADLSPETSLIGVAQDTANDAAGATLGGVVEGLGAPQEGYTVDLYAVEVGGGQATLLGSDTTDGTGGFEIAYTPPPALPGDLQQVLYILAERDSSMLASAIGAASGDDSVVVNERTTVAIGTSFAQFIDERNISGSTYGVQNAVMMAANMADPATGLIGEVLDNSPNADETSTRETFNSLANIVASCVADAANCDVLFELTTPPGGPAPTTVLQAVANMTKFPSNNVADLFSLGDNGTLTPALTSAPASWLLFIKFTGGFFSEYDFTNLMSGPGNIAFDERGVAWVTDNYVPTPRGAVGCAGLRLLKFQPWGEPFPGSPYFGGGLSGAGFGITLDPNGNVWVGNFGFEAPVCDGSIPPDPANKIPATHDSVSLFRPDGTPVSPPEGFTDGDIWWPQATESDNQGNIWVANCGNDTVTFIPDGEPSEARNITLPGGQGAAGHLRPVFPEREPLIKPFDIAIGPSGRAWVTGNLADGLFIVSPDGTVESVETRGLLSWPMGISSDSQGNMWVSNSGAVNVPCVTPLDPQQDDASVVLFPADGSPPSQHTGGGISVPWGNTIDGNDTLWVFNFGHQPMDALSEDTSWPDTGVSHFCGADTSKCPAGLSTGDPISPPVTGYVSDALDRVTGGGVDPSGNLWLLNNWKKAGPFEPVYNTNPGGNSFVIVPGAAKPVTDEVEPARPVRVQPRLTG